MWRACKGILPTHHNLAKRKVASSDACVLCGESENTGHTLWNCSFTSEVWKAAGVVLPNGQCSQEDFVDIVWRLREGPNVLDWELFATTAWGLWNNRNAVKHEGKCKPAKCIARDMALYVDEFRQAVRSPLSTLARPPSVRNSWRPPKAGWYKINVDGAVFKEIGCCGIGVVIRNEIGLIMGAMSKKLPFPLGALEVEARAAEEGVALARDLGLGEIIIEGDTTIITNALSSQSTPPSSIQKVVEGTKSVLQECTAWEVNHVNRCNNFAAHLLAQYARVVSDSVVWVEDTPPVIACQVSLDVSMLGLCPF